jgi:hypothetical protein
VIWLCRIAKSLLAILRQPIAKQAMPFGDHLLLKKQMQFEYVLLLNICWRLGDEQSLSVRELFCDYLLVNIYWQFWRPLIALNRKDRV